MQDIMSTPQVEAEPTSPEIEVASPAELVEIRLLDKIETIENKALCR